MKTNQFFSDNPKQAILDWFGVRVVRDIPNDDKYHYPTKNKRGYSIKVNKDNTLANGQNFITGENRTYIKPKKQKAKNEPQTKPQDLEDLRNYFNRLPLAKEHPYLKDKKIKLPEGSDIRISGKFLVIPFYFRGKLSTLQFIPSEKNAKDKWDKINKKGFKFSGTYCLIGKPTDRLYICEGGSTACSIHARTGHQVAGCAGIGSIPEVYNFFYEQYPQKIIIISLDNDSKEGEDSPTWKGFKKLNNERAVIICPYKYGDFNDFQDNEFEVNKLINLKPLWTPPKEKELPKFIHYPKDDLLDIKSRFDALEYEIRLNTRTDQIEIQIDNKWQAITDEFKSKLWFKVQQLKDQQNEIRKVKIAIFKEALKALSYDKQVDPFKEYLENLEWDGEKRIENILFTFFDIEKGYESLAKWAGMSIFLSVVWRTFIPGHKHDEVPILAGKQGICKSLFLYSLLEDKSLFTNTLNLSDTNVRITESIKSKALVELAELQGFGKAALDKMKNLITTPKDNARCAYKEHEKDFYRRCSFVGSTNDETPLPDDLTGLRRFIVIKLKEKVTDTKLKEMIEKDRSQYWGEAVSLFREKKTARLPKNLWKKSAEVAEKARGGDRAFEEVFLSIILKKKPDEDNIIRINITSILKLMKDGEEKEGSDGKIRRVGGGWIRDISKNYQNKAAELLKREGFITHPDNRKYVDGQRVRIWEKEVKSDKNGISKAPF